MDKSFNWTLQGGCCISAVTVKAGTYFSSLYAAFQILEIGLAHIWKVCVVVAQGVYNFM